MVVLGLILHLNTNFNIIATASLAVYAGSWRSVKPTPPTESMTKKEAILGRVHQRERYMMVFWCFSSSAGDVTRMTCASARQLIFSTPRLHEGQACGQVQGFNPRVQPQPLHATAAPRR